MKLKIVFMGSPQFGVTILEGLIKNNFKPVLLITAPDKLVGRKQILTPPPIKTIAQKYNIPVAQPANIRNQESEIRNFKPDLIIVAAYGQILPKEILEIPKYGCLNIHPSLLPKYRGANPIKSAILNGDEKTGITILLMDNKVDHGPIISQKSIKISPEDTGKTLEEKLADLSIGLVVETIPKWIKGEIKLKVQDESKVIYTKILKKEDGRIDWEKPAEEIERKIRAFHPWPGSFTFWRKNDNKILRIKILKTQVGKLQNAKNYSKGQVFINSENKTCVRCGKGFLIIEKLQLEGKKPTNSKEFSKGHPNFINSILK